MSPKMMLIDLLLRQNTGVSLRKYLMKARRDTPDHRPETWDQIAHQVWNQTGEKVVRETMINYARRFGIPVNRPLAAKEVAEPPADARRPG
jgi:hypothetical protein